LGQFTIENGRCKFCKTLIPGRWGQTSTTDKTPSLR
jgi:hypothetical protein